MNKEKDARTILLFGKEKFNKLKNAHVLIVGLGGVGGYAAEQLCRAGINKFTLIDADIINESNLNRQIVALNSTIGKNKIDVLSSRLKEINSEIEISSEKIFISEENAEELLVQHSPAYVVDAIDTLSPKVGLITFCLKHNIPVVSSMGAGGKIDPGKVVVSDINKTFNCALARKLRKKLHKIGIRTGFKAVFSPENVNTEAMILEESRNKKSNLGTVSYMPAIFGMFCAATVIRDLIEN